MNTQVSIDIDATMEVPVIDFKFIEFNPRRAMRGVEAARVEVIDADHSQWIWMSNKDPSENIKNFGEHAELLKAQCAYAAFP